MPTHNTKDIHRPRRSPSTRDTSHNRINDKQNNRRRSGHKNNNTSYLSHFLLGLKQFWANRNNIHNKKYLSICFGILFVILSVFFIWLFTNKNSYEVYVGTTKIGIIKEGKNITKENLYSLATNKLSNEIGMKIQTNEELVLKNVHASKKEMMLEDKIISEISKAFTYNVEATIISVDNMHIAILKNEKEANDVLENIKKAYEQPNLNIISTEFVEQDSINISQEFVPITDVISMDKAYEKLTEKIDTEQTYIVQPKDTLSKIASNAGMKLDDLYKINPSLNGSDKVRVGQEIFLHIPVPLLSVKTVEEDTYFDIAPKQKEVIQNPNQRKSYSKVVQQGKDGQKQVTVHIIRINGYQTEKNIISENITVQPINDIIEVGTK